MTPADPELSARAAQLLYAYARAVDESDLDTLEQLATADCDITRSGETRHGREEFLAVYRGFAQSGVRRSAHVVTNVQAFAQDDGTVLAEAYFAATMFDPEGSRIVTGRYTDSMRADDGTWRFVHKRIRVDGVLTLPTADHTWTGVAPAPAPS